MIQQEKDRYTCVFCGKDIFNIRERHNAAPLNIKKDCCIKCNEKYVIPARKVLWMFELETLNNIRPYVSKITKNELDKIVTCDEKEQFEAFVRKIQEHGYKGQFVFVGGKIYEPKGS